DLDVDDPSDVDVNTDGINDEPLTAFSGFRVLTLRGALAFLAVGGWTAYGFYTVVGAWLSVLFGIVAGAVAAYLLALAFRATMKLENEGNLDYHNAVGKIGTIYIKVPKSRIGSGKVTLTIQERFIEADAVTEDLQDLTTGTAVDIIGVVNETTLVVTKKASPDSETKI
ncbi:MAG: hypothetical protein V1761_04870, partial [bacterium]